MKKKKKKIKYFVGNAFNCTPLRGSLVLPAGFVGWRGGIKEFWEAAERITAAFAATSGGSPTRSPNPWCLNPSASPQENVQGIKMTPVLY